MKEEPKRPLLNITVPLSFLLTLAMGLLYFYGYVYRTFYLNEFGLDQHVFAEPVEQTLITGFSTIHLAVKKNIKPAFVLLATFCGIGCVFLLAFRVAPKKRGFFQFLITFAFMAFFIVSLSGAMTILWRFAWTEGKQSAKDLKRQIEARHGIEAVILYDGGETKTPKQLKGSIVATSPNGFAIYAEGKVNFIPASRLIQISYPIK